MILPMPKTVLHDANLDAMSDDDLRDYAPMMAAELRARRSRDELHALAVRVAREKLPEYVIATAGLSEDDVRRFRALDAEARRVDGEGERGDDALRGVPEIAVAAREMVTAIIGVEDLGANVAAHRFALAILAAAREGKS